MKQPSGTETSGVGPAGRPSVLYRLSAIAILLVAGTTLFWDVARYDPRSGFEAQAHFDYVEILKQDQRLPRSDEIQHEWQIPPLFFATAAVLDTSCSFLGGSDALCVKGKVTQYFNVVAALGLIVIVLLIAREVIPQAPVAHLGAMAAVAFSPPLTRAAVMFYPEVLATLLAAAAVLVVVRRLSGCAVASVRAGLLGGLLMGGAILTRQMALTTLGGLTLVLVLTFWWSRRPALTKMSAVFVLSAALVASPWFIHQHVVYGSPFAQGLVAPDVPFYQRQPLAFYIGGPWTPVFTQPYRPSYENHMPQVLYTDWWGDYFEYFEARPHLTEVPLPEKYHDALVRQSFVGIVPTLLTLAGLVLLSVHGWRRRRSTFLVPFSILGCLAVAALYFYVGFPVPDGDTMKAIYLLTGLPVLSVAAGYGLEELRRRTNVYAFGAVLVLLAFGTITNLRFLWLDQVVVP